MTDVPLAPRAGRSYERRSRPVIIARTRFSRCAMLAAITPAVWSKTGGVAPERY